MEEKKLKVVELFAGVGGFRLGLEECPFEVIWSNQWEPSTKIQHASNVYEARFGKENHYNEDIATIDVQEIPDHDLLVGGFPCQDYSVATTLNNSKGLKGKKGVLWWSIHKILEQKENKPPYLLLENVDRLLKSPSKQRGRDFAVMLQSLNLLGYAVEWRVINAAEYGMPQRRRRIFILAYLESSPVYERLKQSKKRDWLLNDGLFAKAFEAETWISSPKTSGRPVDGGLFADFFSVETDTDLEEFQLNEDLVSISDNFNKGGKLSPFQNTGMMLHGKVSTLKTVPTYHGNRSKLKDVLDNGEVGPEFFIDEKDIPKWEYLKGAKSIERTSSEGFVYKYSEGGMIYPDSIENPSRTIVTGEGGKSPSRFNHVISTKKGLRRLTPLELERLNMFPDNHTKLEGITDAKRAFFMGNALVVGVVVKIGKELYRQIKSPE